MQSQRIGSWRVVPEGGEASILGVGCGAPRGSVANVLDEPIGFTMILLGPV